MNTTYIYMNSKTSKTPDPHRLLLSLQDKIGLGRRGKHIALSNLSSYYAQKNKKISFKNNKFKISAPTWNEELSYLMDHILYHIFKIILNIY